MNGGEMKSRAKGPWQKVKVDRQAVDVTRMHGVDELNRDDDDAVGSKHLTSWSQGASPTCLFRR